MERLPDRPSPWQAAGRFAFDVVLTLALGMALAAILITLLVLVSIGFVS